MSNDFYNVTGKPATSASGASADMRAEFALIAAGFAKLPTLTGKGGQIPYINSAGTLITSASGLTFDGTTLTAPAVTVSGGRFQESSGAVVASASTVTLGDDGNTFEISGTTAVDRIANASWQDGSVVRLFFSSGLTVNNGKTAVPGANGIVLKSGANTAYAAGSLLSLVYTSGFWYET